MIFSYKDWDSECNITYDNSYTIRITTPEVLKFREAAELLNGIELIDTIDFKLQGSQYKYKIKLKDNRIWEQRLLFDISTDPLLTFQPTDSFRVLFSTTQKIVRDSLIQLYIHQKVSDVSYKKL